MSAVKIIFASLFLYVLMWMVAPLRIVYYPSTLSLILILSMFIAMFLGAASYGLAKDVNYKSHYLDERFILSVENKVFKIILLMALVGLLFRVIDKVLIRDILSYDSAVGRRDSETQASIFGVISAPLYSLLLTLPIFLRQVQGRLRRFLLFFLFFIPSMEVVFMGSRGLAVTSLFMFCIYFITMFRVRGRHLVIGVLFAVLFLCGSGLVFLERIESYGLEPLYSAYNSVYAFTLTPDSWASGVIGKNGLASFVFFIIVNFLQYFLHGILEFSYLIDHFGSFVYQDGAYTFRVLGKLFGSSADYVEMTPRAGIYTTFLGPLWVDFGVFSLVFCFLWGWGLAFSSNKVNAGLFQYLPLYAYMGAVAFFSPVVNLIQNALGVYVLSACIGTIFLFWLCGVLLRRRRIGQDFC
ncbi:hypothetical protein [Castellaniella sp.]|uniref:hypothetical protein n=1 Tax=Castellaniella sp. TaxID=1955812 RepID=UPI003C735196